MTFVHRYDLVRPDATLRYWTGGAAGGRTVVLLARGVEHALMWAQYATAAPPVPSKTPTIGEQA